MGKKKVSILMEINSTEMRRAFMAVLAMCQEKVVNPIEVVGFTRSVSLIGLKTKIGRTNTGKSKEAT